MTAQQNRAPLGCRQCGHIILVTVTTSGRIEAMEKQEPVKQEFQGRDGTWHSFIDQRHYENTVADGTWPIRSLYTLPGAKGE